MQLLMTFEIFCMECGCQLDTKISPNGPRWDPIRNTYSFRVGLCKKCSQHKIVEPNESGEAGTGSPSPLDHNARRTRLPDVGADREARPGPQQAQPDTVPPSCMECRYARAFHDKCRECNDI